MQISHLECLFSLTFLMETERIWRKWTVKAWKWEVFVCISFHYKYFNVLPTAKYQEITFWDFNWAFQRQLMALSIHWLHYEMYRYEYVFLKISWGWVTQCLNCLYFHELLLHRPCFSYLSFCTITCKSYLTCHNRILDKTVSKRNKYFYYCNPQCFYLDVKMSTVFLGNAMYRLLHNFFRAKMVFLLASVLAQTAHSCLETLSYVPFPFYPATNQS